MEAGIDLPTRARNRRFSSPARKWTRGIIFLLFFGAFCIASTALSSDEGPANCSGVAVSFVMEANEAAGAQQAASSEHVLNLDIDMLLTNSCPEPQRTRDGSSVHYRTNLPRVIGERVQPEECLEGRLSAVTTLPPMQQVKLSNPIKNCLIPVDSNEELAVTIDEGSLMLEDGARQVVGSLRLVAPWQ